MILSILGGKGRLLEDTGSRRSKGLVGHNYSERRRRKKGWGRKYCMNHQDYVAIDQKENLESRWKRRER